MGQNPRVPAHVINVAIIYLDMFHRFKSYESREHLKAVRRRARDTDKILIVKRLERKI